MATRYRLKLSVPSVGGLAGTVLRLFPNALTFVGYPTEQQLEFVTAAAAILGAFGVSISVEVG